MNSKKKEGWSRQLTLKLIFELKPRQLLYKINHPDYFKVHKKKEAIEEVVAALQPFKTNITADDVKRKIKILRQQIVIEKKKINAAMKSDMTADAYVPTLWCFNELSFILDPDDDIGDQKNMEMKKLDDDSDDSFRESEFSCSSSKKPKRSIMQEVSASEEKECWSRQLILKLISEWKQREHLYKVAHPDYSNDFKRRHAIEEIVAALRHLKTNFTAKDVKKKMKILRNQLSVEKKNIIAAARSGMAAEEGYVPKLWCFKELRFLLDANDEMEKLDDSFSGNEFNCGSSKKAKLSIMREVSSLRQSATKSMELVNRLIEKRSAEEDGKEEAFCKMLCFELKELKFEESYESVTTEMLLLVRKAKSDELKKLYC